MPNFFFLFLNFDTVFTNSTPEKTANIWRIQRDGIGVIKFKAARIQRGKLTTGSRVQSIPHTFAFLFDVALSLLNLSNISGREGRTRPIFGYRWAAEGLEPWPCLGPNNPKYIPMFRTTPSILLPCLGQRSKWTPFYCILKQFIGNPNGPIRYSHFFRMLGVQTNFVRQVKSIVQAIPCL